MKITIGGGKRLMGKLRSIAGITKNKLFYSLQDLRLTNLRLYRQKDLYEDQRCFVVGGGPSMKKVNPKMLLYEYTAGLNMVYRSGLKTDFNFVCGYKILRDYGGEVLKLPGLFLGCSAGRYYLKNKRSFDYYKKLTTDTKIPIIIKDYGEISVWKDISYDMIKGARGGDSVSFFALQVLLYLGFKEIYLLGHDCDYTNGYFYENRSQSGERNWEKIFKNYEILKECYERKGAKIYNATPGGKLEVFERVNLKDILGGTKNAKS